MVHRYRMSLDELSYIYDSAKGRMDAHPEVAKKYEAVLREQTYFKTEKRTSCVYSNIVLFCFCYRCKRCLPLS